MARFEAGETYRSMSFFRYEPITVIRRTDTSVWVKDRTDIWRMKIRNGADGIEYLFDTRCPGEKWRADYTYRADMKAV